MAEEIALQRIISLSEYNDVRIHISCISTDGSVSLIRQAKQKGLKITCDVAAYNLLLDDEWLNTFDSNYKVKPFLRTSKDINALIEGIADGTIDAICSNHTPQDDETKKVEFDYASFGITALETTFGILNKALSGIVEVDKMIDLITVAPRNILSLKQSVIGEGELACLTIFDTEYDWHYNLDTTKSKSKNTPFHNFKLKGKAIAVVNNNQLEFC